MKTTTALLIALVTLVTARAADQRCFVTEASVTLDQTTGHHLIVAKVSEWIPIQTKVPVLGDLKMKLIAAPRMTVVAGKAASITDTQSDGTSVRADVFWPESGSDKPATLVITLSSTTNLLSRSSFTLDLEKE
jgi:hypothetical protein